MEKPENWEYLEALGYDWFQIFVCFCSPTDGISWLSIKVTQSCIAKWPSFLQTLVNVVSLVMIFN